MLEKDLGGKAHQDGEVGKAHGKEGCEGEKAVQDYVSFSQKMMFQGCLVGVFVSMIGLWAFQSVAVLLVGPFGRFFEEVLVRRFGLVALR